MSGVSGVGDEELEGLQASTAKIENTVLATTMLATRIERMRGAYDEKPARVYPAWGTATSVLDLHAVIGYLLPKRRNADVQAQLPRSTTPHACQVSRELQQPSVQHARSRLLPSVHRQSDAARGPDGRVCGMSASQVSRSRAVTTCPEVV